MDKRLLMAAFAMAAPGLASAGDMYAYASPPRRSSFRKGRRFGYGFSLSRGMPGEHNPAGTKLAKLAAKGLLTKCRIH